MVSGGREERRECQWGRSGDEGGRRDEGTRGEASAVRLVPVYAMIVLLLACRRGGG